MRVRVLAPLVLALLPLAGANAAIVRSGSYDLGDPLAYDFGVDECERIVLARVLALTWPQTSTDSACIAVPSGYAGHAFSMTMGGARPPSQWQACYVSQASELLGCDNARIKPGAALMGVSSPDGVLVSFRMDINGS